jgi:carboxypeptidase PM20D1
LKKRLLRALTLALLLLFLVLTFETLRFHSRQLGVQPVPERALSPAESQARVERLQKAIGFRTISSSDPAKIDRAQFDAFHAFLAQAFPRFHQATTREQVGESSLLFTWKGSQPGERPILLMAHQDVVPVEPGTEGAWKFPPFEGHVDDDGYLWGRGTLDDKAALLALLESAEQLLAEGFVPRRTIYFGFGADEEIDGADGAIRFAQLFAARGVKLAWVLDEGLPLTEGIVPGVNAKVASIGIAEKGSLSLELRAEADGGHSSMPPPTTAVGRIARAVERLETQPFAPRLDGVAASTFDYLGPELPLVRRVALANRWLFGRLLIAQLAKSPTTAALLHTTTAATMLSGGVKENVLPQRATAVVNFRILPGDSIASVLAHVRATVDDASLAVTPLASLRSEPSPVARLDGPGFRLLHETVREIFPGAIVAPGLVLGATDSRHLAPVADTYRFLPWLFHADDPARVHGTNERISIANYQQGIRFFAQLLKNANGL